MLRQGSTRILSRQHKVGKTGTQKATDLHNVLFELRGEWFTLTFIRLSLHLAIRLLISSEVKVRNTKAQVVVSMRPSFYQTTDDFIVVSHR